MASQTLPIQRFFRLSAQRSWTAQIIVGALLLALVAGLGLNSYLGSRFSPEGVAVAYEQAMSRGDASAAWSMAAISEPALTSGQADEATEPGLAAQLSNPANRPRFDNPTVAESRSVDGGREVTLHGLGSVQTVLLTLDQGSRQFGLYPSWKVSVQPSTLKVLSPGVPAYLDGRPLPDGATSALVLPGTHQLSSRATSLFGAYSTRVFAAAGQSASGSLQPAVTSAGRAAAATAVKQAISDCMSNAYGRTCPAAFLQDRGTWLQVGDPTADLSVSVGPDGRPEAMGHYLATVHVADAYSTSDQVVGGPYSASLSSAAGALAVTSLVEGTNVPPLVRPASVSDAQLLDAARSALDACAKSTDWAPSNCPQRIEPPVNPSGFHWSWRSDPMAGAKASYDGNTGIFHVTGPFAAAASYTENLYVSEPITKVSTGTFDAEIVYDGAALDVVTVGTL